MPPPLCLNRFSYYHPTIKSPAKSKSDQFLIKSPNPKKLNFSTSSSSSTSSSFDSAAFEADRLRLDAEARDSMAAAASEEEVAGDPKAWKWRIRKRVWDLMERENVAQNPRPVHHRIPNFVGAAKAADLLGGLEAFKTAQCVKVNPDSPQKQVRFLTLTGRIDFSFCLRPNLLVK